eukprot:c16336_g1_i1.p1 GENE.c16336_g1_i1~~c16336_g1_i1.p1  ORF type:complete len:761 (+),score=92.82 c16336_g1_i1:2-2284(+)
MGGCASMLRYLLGLTLAGACFGQTVVCTGANADYCNVNCNHFPPYCPTTFCTCAPANSCVAIGVGAGIPGINDWCRDNCRQNYCPADLCSQSCAPPTGTTPTASPPPTIDLVLPGGRFSFQPSTLVLLRSNTLAAISINGPVTALADGVALSTLVSPDGASLTATGLVGGITSLVVTAVDNFGRALAFSQTIVVGTGDLTVTVLNENGAPVANTQVKVQLLDDTRFGASGVTDTTGRSVIRNVPSDTLTVTCLFNGQDIGTAIQLGPGAITVILFSANRPPATTRNLDFSGGTANGWVLPASGRFRIAPHPGNLKQANNDLIITTAGLSSPSTASFTFLTNPGTTTVRVRYRLVTSEFPTFYGSQFDDSYSVTLQVAGANGGPGLSTADVGSVRSFPFASISSDGSAPFKDLSLGGLDPSGNQLITVRVSVQNAMDSVFDSQVEIDFVQETSFSVTAANLFDFLPSPSVAPTPSLQFLSCDAIPGTYYGSGINRIRAQIRIDGTPSTIVQRVELVIAGANTVSVELVASAQGALYKAIGSSGTLSLDQQVAFEIPGSVLETVVIPTNNLLTLSIRATTTSGQSSTKVFGTVQALKRWKSGNRFGLRDEDQGGDDWALPVVLNAAKLLAGENPGLLYGDFSNMNAGEFTPYRFSHDVGASVDATLISSTRAVFSPTTAAAATTLINMIKKSKIGNLICQIRVAGANSLFMNQVASAAPFTAQDTRRPSQVIVAANGQNVLNVLQPSRFEIAFSSNGSPCKV